MVCHRFLLTKTASRPILGAVAVSKSLTFPIGELRTEEVMKPVRVRYARWAGLGRSNGLEKTKGYSPIHDPRVRGIRRPVTLRCGLRVTPCCFIWSTTVLAPSSPSAASLAVWPASVSSCWRRLTASRTVGSYERRSAAKAPRSWIAAPVSNTRGRRRAG